MLYENYTIREIDRKLKDVVGNPEFHLRMCNKRQNGLHRTEFLNSFLLEHPEYYKRDSNELHRGYTKRIRKGVARLQYAWDYLRNLRGPIPERLGEKEIFEIGELVDPSNNSYRTVRVTLGLKDYCPPNPLKIPFLIDDFLEQLKNPQFHPIERAAFAHSRIAAIQPFLDGNKRTARLIQNNILCENGYPYATIPLGEREYYLDLLTQSMCAYRDEDLKRMGPFFNYIAAKVNMGLDEILFAEEKRRRKS